MSDESEAAAARDPEDASAGQDAVRQDATGEDAAAQGAGGGGGADDERLREAIDELRRLRVEDLAFDMAVSLVTVGYQKLGLTEQTREVRDLDGARLSIELLRACLDVLERERGAAGLGDLRATLSAMQINYARAVDEGRVAPAEAGDQVGSAEQEDPGEQVAPAAPSDGD